MRSRAADAPIKGYFYQFDHTIIQILSASHMDAEVVVEGIEDIDLEDNGVQTFIQCKYYEETVIQPFCDKRCCHTNGSAFS